jgi:transposase-like protein
MIEGFNSLIELIDYFDSEEKCIKHAQEKRWGGNITCPHCEHDKIYAFSDGKRFKCAKCRKQFTVCVGTMFEDSKIPLRKWFIAIYLLTSHKKGISSYQLAKDIQVRQRTAWFLMQRIRHQFGLDNPTDGKMLEGRIEADETFVGGKNKNRHWDKKVPHSQGRSFKDKTPVLGLLQEQVTEIVERPSKVIPDKIVKEKIILQHSIIRCKTAANTSEQNLFQHTTKHTAKNATFISDEWGGYGFAHLYYNHIIIDHSRGQYVTPEGDTTNALEGAWQQLKLSITGIYHKVSRRHLQRYVDEFTFRYNTRHMREDERVDHVLSIKGGSLKWRDLTKKT